jgi:hypothetical protein
MARSRSRSQRAIHWIEVNQTSRCVFMMVTSNWDTPIQYRGVEVSEAIQDTNKPSLELRENKDLGFLINNRILSGEYSDNTLMNPLIRVI